MTRFTAVSKKTLALFMALLMLFSGMAVTASAENETNPIPDFEAVINADRTITVEKFAQINGVDVVVTVSPNEGVIQSYDANGNYLYSQLTAGTKYTFTATLTASETEVYTKTAEATLKNAQATPAAPVPTAITSSSITVKVVSGCSYMLKTVDGEVVYDWATPEAGYSAIQFSENIKSETKYVVCAKKAETADYYESPVASVTVTTKKAANATAAAAPVLADKTNASITVVEIEGVEFSIDAGKKWQTSGEFTGLKADTQYSIIARDKYDAAAQDANPISAATLVKTNARANKEAVKKNCSFTAEDGKRYAGTNISFTVKGDAPVTDANAIYGDTRIVPYKYVVACGTDEIKALTDFNATTISATGNFTTAESHANSTVIVRVAYKIEECKGKNADNSPRWEIVEIFTEDYNVEIGRVDGAMTKIAEFFEGIINFFLNTLPSLIVGAMGSDIWGKIF